VNPVSENCFPTPVIAMAADCVLVEVDELCSEPLDPDIVVIPGVLVDHVVQAQRGGTICKRVSGSHNRRAVRTSRCPRCLWMFC
jgi:acyl CoA:acetate/3-ketoacid CoA transferase